MVPARSLVTIMPLRRPAGITQMSDFSTLLDKNAVCYARGALIEWSDSWMGAEIVTKTITFERATLPTQEPGASNTGGSRGGPGGPEVPARRGTGL